MFLYLFTGLSLHISLSRSHSLNLFKGLSLSISFTLSLAHSLSLNIFLTLSFFDPLSSLVLHSFFFFALSLFLNVSISLSLSSFFLAHTSPSLTSYSQQKHITDSDHRQTRFVSSQLCSSCSVTITYPGK